MIQITIVYTNNEVDKFNLITYVRGEGHWQLLCSDGKTVLIPDASVVKMVISSPPQDAEESE